MTMNSQIYRYRFGTTVPMRDVEESLLLAAMAAESLHGRSLLRLDGAFCLDAEKRAAVVDGGTDVGQAIAKIFTGFLSKEFGDQAFQVERVAKQPGSAERRRRSQ